MSPYEASLAYYVAVQATHSGHGGAPPLGTACRQLRTAYPNVGGMDTRGANKDSRHPSSRDVSQVCYLQSASDDVRGRSRDAFERWEN